MHLGRALGAAWLTAVAAAGLLCLVVPAATLLVDFARPDAGSARLRANLLDWHAALAARIEPWARERTGSSRPGDLSRRDVPGTEWPLFGAVFFLWATESVQAMWSIDGLPGPSPVERTAGAIHAAADLVADPAHAAWVRAHWGETYLDRENLFYRMLLVAGLDAFERLTGELRHHVMLVDQVERLGAELDASPHGLLEDYPGEAYSVDILLAYAAIARAADRLDRADPARVTRARRAFEGALLDPGTGLPAYAVDAIEGRALGPARGVGLSMMLVFADRLWPALAERWYADYTARFWQRRFGIEGFREFAPTPDGAFDWLTEVDAGPVVGGFGTAASAFGLAAVRQHGDVRRTTALTPLALVASWPLFDGTLLGPRLLSSLTDSPYVGESAVLFSLARNPALRIDREPGDVPPTLWIILVTALLVGVLDPAWRIARWRRAARRA
jgi:hypothetical protein